MTEKERFQVPSLCLAKRKLIHVINISFTFTIEMWLPVLRDTNLLIKVTSQKKEKLFFSFKKYLHRNYARLTSLPDLLVVH